MDRLDKLAGYFNEKERRRLDNKAKDNKDGIPEMSFEEVRLSCMENNGYETPELNDKLYLHFRGFKRIENLEKFTGCKSIWLDSNGFDKIENLSALTELRCIYLSKNLISRIKGLETLKNLTILDLSNNRLTMIDNLSCCPMLQTVNFSHNYLSTPESLLHLQECPSITNIDVTNNRLVADESFFNILKDIPSIVAISINGNEVTKLPIFRKRMIASIPKLGYLDRPVDAQERCFAEAYVAGGAEAETAARNKWKEDLNNKRINEMNEYKAWQAEQVKIREKARAEGRSLITEMTPEEVARRAEEVQTAVDAERAMLELGIDKVASRFWKLDGSSGAKGDALEEATKQLLAERSRETASKTSPRVEELPDKEEEPAAAVAFAEAGCVESVDAQDIRIDIVELDSTTETTTVTTGSTTSSNGLTAAAAAFVASAQASASRVLEIDEADVASAVTRLTIEEVVEVEVEEVESESVMRQREADEAARLQELQEQRIREIRVDESFAIYKRQLEARKSGNSATTAGDNSNHNTGNNDSSVNPSGHVPVSTWDAPTVAEPVSVADTRPLYWTEHMDIELAKQVQACVFDFEEIAVKMQQAARGGALGKGTIVHATPTLLTNEVCRIRWSQLDAAQWSETNPEYTPLDTVFKINISSTVIGSGHGAQPNFSQLASLSAGSMPTYLTPPASFPCVRDMKLEGDVDSDLDLD